MASCPANIRETKIAFGKVPQTDLVTPNLPADLWSVLKTNTALMQTDLRTETDALDIGKGDEFPLTVYKTASSTGVALEKYCTSEFMAWLFCFGLGAATKSTGTGGGITYAATPQDPVVACINQPAFSYAEQIRAEPDSVIDREAVGMVVNDFTITMESGPGRANCRVAANFLGTGQIVNPSGITPWPTPLSEHLLNASGTTVLNINGIEYLLGNAKGRFNNLEFRWNNNTRTDSGYFPGSGMQNGFAIRGRMEFNVREVSLTFVARAIEGSVEYSNLLSLTEGPTTITVQGAQISGTDYHQMNLYFPRTIISAVTNADADGIVTVNCTVQILKPTDGVTPLCTLSATTSEIGIFGLAAKTARPPLPETKAA